MKIRKTFSINDLYETVKDYNLVLTVEAPLADALNNRLDEARFGGFATTPKRLIWESVRNRDLADARELFIRVTRETNLTWKESFYLLDNILSCWRETGELRKILEFDQFDKEKTREVINIIENTPNIYKALEDYSPAENLSTAVIGLYQFNELDKKVLPDDYDLIEVFEEGERTLPEFKIFSTVTSLVQAVRDNVSRENAEDVAVVTSPESQYSSLVKSVFRAEGIPFMVSEDFSEDEDLRTLLALLRHSLSAERLKVREVQPVLRRLGLNISIVHNDEYLSDLEIDDLNEFKKILEDVSDLTFEETLQNMWDFMENPSEIRDKLDEIDMLGERVSPESVNRLEYYLDSFDIQIGGGKRGVLIASSKSASYIDRPIVFHLGMDSSWMHEKPEKPWVDEEKYEEKNLKNFKLLLQNGEQQHFLVRASHLGDKIAPCLYLDELAGKPLDSFHDLPSTEYWGLKRSEGIAFEKEDLDVETERIKTISQSKLNNLVKSPRLHFLSELVPSENRDYFKIGNLLHDFAEFYANHPDLVKERGLEDFVDIMMEEIKPLVDNLQLNQLKTKFRVGAENIVEYLDREDIGLEEISGYREGYSENTFEKHFDEPLSIDVAELRFDNPDIGIKGRVDLIPRKNRVVDYKTGDYKSPQSVVGSSNIELFEDDPNFQAIQYLTHHRQIESDSKLEMVFYHVLENERDRVTGNADIEDNFSIITYYPRTFSDQLAERETFECLKSSNKRRKILNKLGYDRYRDFFEPRDLPHEYDKKELPDSDLADEFISYSKDIIGEFKYVEKGCKSVLKKLVDFRRNNFFEGDLDKFENFVEEQLKQLNEYKRSKFPIGDIDRDELRMRDLLLGDDFGT